MSMFEIEITEEVLVDLSGFKKREQSIILDSIYASLSHKPTTFDSPNVVDRPQLLPIAYQHKRSPIIGILIAARLQHRHLGIPQRLGLTDLWLR